MTEEEFLNDIVKRQNTIELQARRISELKREKQKITLDYLAAQDQAIENYQRGYTEALEKMAGYIAEAIRSALEGKADD